MRSVSLTALRRIVVGAQGYAARSRTGTRREVEEAIRALSCVQLDSITAVERSHRIALGSRVGAYPRETVSRLLGQGRIFEYWAHEACLIPVEEWPLFRAPMQAHHPWHGDVIGKHPELAEEVRSRRARARPARLTRLRGQGRWRDVELEAREGHARGALELGRGRDRRPRQWLPAALRRRRASDPARGPRLHRSRTSRRACESSPCARSARVAR